MNDLIQLCMRDFTQMSYLKYGSQVYIFEKSLVQLRMLILERDNLRNLKAASQNFTFYVLEEIDSVTELNSSQLTP